MSAPPPEHRRLLSSYRMPAEWEPHLASYIVWPHNLDTWPGKFEPIPPLFAQMAAAIAHFEQLRVLVNDASEIARVPPMVNTLLAAYASPVWLWSSQSHSPMKS